MSQWIELRVPDLGDVKDVPVIEMLVQVGDVIAVDQTLVVLETEKATMDVPSTAAGTVRELRVAVGDKVGVGIVLALLEADGSTAEELAQPPALPVAKAATAFETAAVKLPAAQPIHPAREAPAAVAAAVPEPFATHTLPHASPSIRRFARELGVDLLKVRGTGPKGRIVKSDVDNFVKEALSKPTGGASTAGAPFDLLPWPQVDFAKFGVVERVALSKIKKISGANLSRNSIVIPHVTNFDEADITDVEKFRVDANQRDKGTKLTMLAFVIKASVAALKRHPTFNASLDGEELVLKRYFHIGFAADTPNGLVVPVIRDADTKGLAAIAAEASWLAEQARNGKLKPTDMQGGCFTISSLGGIGGTGFTPIINAPEGGDSRRGAGGHEAGVGWRAVPAAARHAHEPVVGSSGARRRRSGPLPGHADRPAQRFHAGIVMSEPVEAVDLIVIGAGPGGYTAAFRAADLGRSVMLVDRWDTLGGVCLNVGCIPSKALLHAAKTIKESEDFATHGIRFGAPQIELDALRGWKDSVVARLTGGLVELARRRKVKVVRGTARFTGPTTVVIEAADGVRTVSFQQAIIAAGSKAVKLPFLPKDDARVVDSTGALALTQMPKRFLVIGGGIIGLEMATVYEALGSRVTIVELMDQIIPGADRDLVAPLFKRLSGQCESILLKTKVTRVEAQPDGLLAHFEGPDGASSASFDMILVAVGRRPNGKLLAAEAAGVTVAPDGIIPVDAQMRTNVAHIFAIGDIAGQPMLAHKATHEAKVAAEVACGHKAAFDARVIPSVAYTDPEIAWAGLTEAEARRQGIAVEKTVFPWAASGRSLALGRDEGFTKLLFDRKTRRVLGAGIVGANAGDLIAEAALAIEMGADDTDISLTIHPHPTLSETIAGAAEIFAGTITDLPPARR